MNIAVVGSRDFPRMDTVQAFVRGIPEGNTIVSGGARGVDRMASTAAIGAGLHVVEWRVTEREYEGKRGFGPEKWTFDPGDPNGWTQRRLPAAVFRSFGQAAYFRNGLIVQECDVLVAFWDGQSKGTKHAIDLANELGRKVELAGKDS